ncbi:F-type H+-transporting ATPase subunit gamma [Alkalithermobacter thermoalcaliphilus JW-YL-7 = DSM 7308]|uniref:ATP synthase gamma chain n=2 Tax=Clostridium paradoxum TaxID=29346 RepID=A0A150FSD1_CLOPD|nr:ATP synthase subunit gamma [[Clostridium] paradoxum] [[Clostridium] paradoxum JW-YL-7 = DSM 7308]KXZ40523.1 ATP synthase gamma chain [[Clostridium] paradoxum JW-YL-7 = DSM 7308]SHK72028.1 F-type H+-transporting ATPase subunit gamma [[Clostridium] paradoxum JW-YL-7 = DSM 7308]
MAGVGMKDIKRRMKSINNTKQITKAMELVSSAKLRRAKEQAEKSRPYFLTLYNTIKKIAQNTRGVSSTFLERKDVKSKAFIVIAGDRGLAGGYNSNVIKTTLSSMEGKKEKVVPVGKKSIDFFQKRNYDILGKFSGIENMDFSNAKEIAQVCIDAYMKNEVDEVYLVYTEFKSTLIQEPKVLKVLPISFDKEDENEKREIIEYEPSAEAVLDYIVPKFVAGTIYGGIVESFASEQAARRTAMESASDNADEMISKLELSYNRARQSSITQEISEIVAGAEALK